MGFEAQKQAWLDAAEFVDEKWERAAEQANRCEQDSHGSSAMRPANIALGQNTHELVRAGCRPFLPLALPPRDH